MRRNRTRTTSGLLVGFLATLSLVAPAARAGGPPTCFGRAATIVGTDGDDTIHGTGHADVIVTGDGNDTVHGGRGNDRICAGNGDDVLYDGAGDDRVDGGEGQDRFIAGSGDDVLRGGDRSTPAYDRVSYENSPRAVVIDLRADTATGYGHDVVKHIWIAAGSPFDGCHARHTARRHVLRRLRGRPDVRPRRTGPLLRRRQQPGLLRTGDG